ncbi:MAG: hypothetical protein KGL39_45185 [Patescibacteria group bacterium]|nr:hypothetical protein [Patescibacteria group bacterium]
METEIENGAENAAEQTHVENGAENENTKVENAAEAAKDDGAEVTDDNAAAPAKPAEEEKIDYKEFKNLQRQARDQLKRINKITASNYQYKAKIEELEKIAAEARTAAQNRTLAESKPKSSDYKTLDEYNEAFAEWKYKQLAGASGETTQKDVGLSAEDREWAANAERTLTSQSQELRGAIPDYAQFIEDNGQILQQLPFAAQKTILSSSDHPLLALYALDKAGELGRLFEAQTPQQLAQVMKAATDYALQNVRSWVDPKLLQTTQVKPAPKPISSAKGNATVKSEDDLSGKELLKKYRKH